MVLRHWFFGLICFCSHFSLAQVNYSTLDQNPFSVRHRKIQLINFPVQILFPEGLDSLAQVTSNSLEFNLLAVGRGMGSKLHPWKIVLQNQGMLSNGFVSLSAPRAEYFITPTQDPSLIGNNDWISLLAAHESRHMYQNEMGRTGFSKWVHTLWGNNGQMAYTNLMIPNWAWEGDAIETETRINGVGRSLIPQFQMPLRAYIDYYGVPSYTKLMARSYREFVPNHYVFGQYLVGQLQKQYGQEVMGQIWQKALNTPIPFSFSRAVKQMTGSSIDDFSTKNLKNLSATKSVKRKLKAAGFTNYLYPNFVTDTSFVAIKSGFDANMQVVFVSPKAEKRLTYLGPYYDNAMLSASRDFVIWSEYQYHPRWGQKNQTVFYLYDLENQKRIKWKSLGHATNPSISSDSKYIGAIVYKTSGAANLSVYDRVSGQLVAQLAAQPGEQFMQPRLQGASDFIFIQKKGKAKSIQVWDWKENKMRESVDLGAINASHPYLNGVNVVFNMPVDGVDQVISYNLPTKQFSQVTNEKYGAYNGIVLGKSMVYNQYTATGYRSVLAELNHVKAVEIPTHIEKQTSDSLKQYTTSIYSKWNIVNPYAWGPLINAQGNGLDIGVVSKDVLNNLQVSVGYQWNANEQIGNRFARLSYQGFFPVIDFNFESGSRQTTLNLPSTANQFALSSDQWNQTKYSLGIRIPLNLTHSAFQETLEFGSKMEFLQVSGYDLQRRYISEAFNGTYTSMNHQFSYAKLFNRTYRDLQSKWGVQLVGRLISTSFKQSLQAELWSLQSKIYLPGLMPHHGIGVRFGYQQESKGNYRFASNLIFPRGYSYASFDKMFSYSLDYRFPVLTTDLNLGRLFYLKRINSDIFMDGGRGQTMQKSQLNTRDYQSIGVDLSFQFHLMRFLQEFEVGVRGVYLPQSKEVAWYPLVLDIGF
jgi:hypothetical protein